MGGACCTHLLAEECIQAFGGNTRNENFFLDPGVQVGLILKCVLKKYNGMVKTLVNIAMNFDM